MFSLKSRFEVVFPYGFPSRLARANPQPRRLNVALSRADFQTQVALRRCDSDSSWAMSSGSGLGLTFAQHWSTSLVLVCRISGQASDSSERGLFSVVPAGFAWCYLQRVHHLSANIRAALLVPHLSAFLRPCSSRHSFGLLAVRAGSLVSKAPCVRHALRRRAARRPRVAWAMRRSNSRPKYLRSSLAVAGRAPGGGVNRGHGSAGRSDG